MKPLRCASRFEIDDFGKIIGKDDGEVVRSEYRNGCSKRGHESARRAEWRGTEGNR